MTKNDVRSWMHWFRSLQKKWADWTGDRELELAIRRHLSSNGYYGATAKLQHIRLAAVQRPGWRQIYRFDAIARVRPEPSSEEEPAWTAAPIYKQLYGLAREDARRDETAVRVFEHSDARCELFAQWSVDMIQLRGGQSLS